MKVFEEIYANRTWASEPGVGPSGKGSTLDATGTISYALCSLVERYSIRSILDIPCGDYRWMRHVDLTGVRYIGADCVPALIQANRETYPRVDFRLLDITRDELPGADLIFSRDCLVHLSNDQVKAALANVRRSGARLFMATTFPGRTNREIQTGQWRPIDLTAAPFGLPQPIELIDERCTSDDGQYTDKRMGVWRVDW